MNNKQREHFGSRFAVVMAMASSAIGLGNIWRFPYIAGEEGGGIFVLIYIACTLLFSIPIFITEVVIGRSSRMSAANAMYKLSGGRKFWKIVGTILVFCPLWITSYYSVVGGWAVDFLAQSLTFSFNDMDPNAVSGLFTKQITSPMRPVVTHLIFLGLTAAVVSGGVRAGIERFCKYMVPLLFLMIIAIMLYSFSLPGAKAGIVYLFDIDINSISKRTFAYAMGQSFYSLSLGMGTIITYGSYVKSNENILTDGLQVAFSDMFFALLSGLAIMPAVFAAGLEPGAGPGLIFQTIPYVFSQMGQQMPMLSGIIAILFFFTLVMAALTSAVSMFEVGVAYIVENTKITRRKASGIIWIILASVGAFASLGFGPLKNIQLMGMGIFDVMDWFASNILLITASILAMVFAGWVMKKEDFCKELSSNGFYSFNAKIAPMIHFVIRYAAPFIIFVILLSNFV